MPTSNPVDVLLAHDQWATRNLLEACQPLAREQFHRRFEIGPGSLHDTTTHIVGAMRGWGDLLAGREQRQRLEHDGVERTPTELLILFNEIAADLGHWARQYALDEKVTGTRGGKTYTFLRAGVVTHVATHSMHHRAQCLNMLRHLGVSPQPMSSVLEWMLYADDRP